MPFVLDGEGGRVEIEAKNTRHIIDFAVDRIRQEPVIEHCTEPAARQIGTSVRVRWPNSPRSILVDAKARFLQIADDFTWLNPHLTLTVDWFGERTTADATAPTWEKWKPSDLTSPHWYEPQHLERLIGAYLAHDQDCGRVRTCREFISEFRGLSGTAKQKAVLEVTIGEGHFRRRFEAVGCEMESFQYRRLLETDGLPMVVETAFGWCPEIGAERRLVTGVNWSPGIVNPFRQLGKHGESLDTVLTRQRLAPGEPVIMVLHMACPRVEYTDRGKSAVVMS
jgi:hypothetical protein